MVWTSHWYKGSVNKKMCLVIIDSHSKWIEVLPATSITSTETIRLLKSVFITHGLPITIVSDNGTCFSSDEFSLFCRELGIVHKFTAPYHPSSNGVRLNVQFKI